MKNSLLKQRHLYLAVAFGFIPTWFMAALVSGIMLLGNPDSMLEKTIAFLATAVALISPFAGIVCLVLAVIGYVYAWQKPRDHSSNP